MPKVVPMRGARQLRLPIKTNGYAYDALFEEFWSVFPKPVEKYKTRALWNKITSEYGCETASYVSDAGRYEMLFLQANPLQIIEAAKKYRKKQMDPNTYKLRDNGRFTCMSTTWLNQGRWADEE